MKKIEITAPPGFTKEEVESAVALDFMMQCFPDGTRNWINGSRADRAFIIGLILLGASISGVLVAAYDHKDCSPSNDTHEEAGH